MATGGIGRAEVMSIEKSLEISPSKTQASSTLPGTKGDLCHGTAPAKGGDGAAGKKTSSKIGSAKKM